MSQNVEKMVKLVEEAADEKKADNIVILDVGKVSVVADYFVIASGSSRTQVYAIADNIMEKTKEVDYKLLHREGYDDGRWILLDYGDIVVHLFQPEEREFYNLERLWNHAPRLGNNSPDNNVDNTL